MVTLNFLPGAKIVRLVSLWLLAALPLWGQFEPATVRMTEAPKMPARLTRSGVRDGRVLALVDVGPDGKPVEWLVVAATYRELIEPSVTALQRWEYTPARLDGQPVRSRMKLVVDVRSEMTAVTQSVNEAVNRMVERFSGGHRIEYQPCKAGDLDRPLAAIATVAPRYATEAEQTGVRGQVKVQFYIDEKGEVRMPAVVGESDPYLSAKAIEAIRGWKFAPPTSGGRPVLVAAAQDFKFGVE